MSADDVFLSIVCIIVLGAWVEAMGGRRIHRGWSRVYDSLTDALRTTPHHLRGRKPVECGIGTPSETRLKGGLYPISEERRAQILEKRAFEDWLDARRLSPPTVFEYEALRDVWRREQAAMANRHGSGDDLSGWDDLIREHIERAKATTRPAFSLSRVIPGYDVRTQTANGVPLEALLANHLPSVREQAGLANARAFQQRHWDAQMQRPTPAENARRYASEGGTW